MLKTKLNIHRSGQVFVVANYDPPGNFIGSFAENVPPIGGFPDAPKIIIDRVADDSLDSSLTESISREDLELDNFVNAVVRSHNEFRKKHGVPELK